MAELTFESAEGWSWEGTAPGLDIAIPGSATVKEELVADTGSETTGGGAHVQMREMLGTHPQPETKFEEQDLFDCIEACSECAEVCLSCSDACLAEDMVAELRRCIRLNNDCADVCTATGRIIARLTEPDAALINAQLRACIEACRVCAEECDKHAEMHEHCAICAESCRACQRACERLIGAAA